jgi:hypothetical protein
MKTGTADMIEGQEAFDRFRDAAKKMLLGVQECNSESVQEGQNKKTSSSWATQG